MATFTPPSVVTTTNDLGLISNSALQSLLESHDAKELNPIIAQTMVTGLHFSIDPELEALTVSIFKI